MPVGAGIQRSERRAACEREQERAGDGSRTDRSVDRGGPPFSVRAAIEWSETAHGGSGIDTSRLRGRRASMVSGLPESIAGRRHGAERTWRRASTHLVSVERLDSARKAPSSPCGMSPGPCIAAPDQQTSRPLRPPGRRARRRSESDGVRSGQSGPASGRGACLAQRGPPRRDGRARAAARRSRARRASYLQWQGAGWSPPLLTARRGAGAGA